ncbi:arginase family protein [Enterovibrio norvegicus]|uniref:arginase family protein n=1 Tax=Enterovibrio norvegicus TaxID=188144 RepID=UPI000C845C73|nr:arginase family protein [Enterovibrio norvegicus]PML80673.1 arginase [Enterovibrio norvegicus]
MKRSFDLIGAPFNQFGSVKTEKNTLEALRRLDEEHWLGLSEWLEMRNKRWEANIEDKGDVLPDDEAKFLVNHGEDLQGLTRYCEQLKTTVLDSYRAGRTPVVVGGDHAVTLGTMQATLEYFQKEQGEHVAVVWVDAHADCNTGRGNLHGKPLALLMDKYPHDNWSVPADIRLSPQDIYYVAVRDLMLPEAELIKAEGIELNSPEVIDAIGFRTMLDRLIAQLEGNYDRFFVSFDYDALDGAIFRACATPNVGGLSAREALTLVHELAAHPKFVGIDFLEYLPEKDPEGISKEMMIKLIDAAWGYRI